MCTIWCLHLMCRSSRLDSLPFLPIWDWNGCGQDHGCREVQTTLKTHPLNADARLPTLTSPIRIHHQTAF